MQFPKNNSENARVDSQMRNVLVFAARCPARAETAAGVAHRSDQVRKATHRRDRSACNSSCSWRCFADGFVFTKPDGHPVRPSTLSSAFTDVTRELGMPHVRQHDLRHGWATLALEGGVPLKVVSENLGHSTITVTSDRYSHVSDGMARHAVETVASMIGS